MEQAADHIIPAGLPPLSANEVELLVPNFRRKIITPVSQLQANGDPENKLRELANLNIYSDWKDLPNMRFRLMLFPVCPHSDSGNTISDIRISAYIECAPKDDWPENWICYGTRFCIFVIHMNDIQMSLYKKDTFNFSSTESDRGWQGFITHQQIIDGGFLNKNGDLLLRGGVYPMGAEVNRASRDHTYDCRKATGFVGLQNHGATCYMNALLQSLYSITKFRKTVYLLNFRPDEMIGRRSYDIMKRLDRSAGGASHTSSYTDTYKNSKRKTHDTSGSINDQDTDLEVVEDPIPDMDLDENECCAILIEEEEEKKKVPSVSLALQNLFYKLRYAPYAPPCKELMRSFGWDSSDMFTQQDSHELLKLLLDKMEEQMKGTPVEGSVKNMFEGEMETYIECIDIQYKSCRVETFEDIQLDIQGCSDIYESLRKLTEAEILDGENMYEAEGHGKQRARKGIRFLKFPPTCVFLLKRFTFDLQRMDTVKLNDRFEFYKEIDLSPFCSSGGKYVLQAVSVHHGSINSGHYYAFAASSNGEWYRFDDETVCKVSEYAVIGDNFGGEEPDCYNYCESEDNASVKAFRRPKNYNAYILIYVLKDAVDDILGPCDPVKEHYSMITRCSLEERLYNLRHRVRERLSHFIKVKVFDKSDFVGLKFLDQPFMGWLGGKTITFARSTSLSDALHQLSIALDIGISDGKGPDNYFIMGLNKATNRFGCLSEIRTSHNGGSDTLHWLISLIHRDAFQVYDPTLYLLYVPRPPRQSVVTPPQILVFVKYFDIFSDHPDGDGLICVDVTYVSTNRCISQISGTVLRKVLDMMKQNQVTPYNVSGISRCISRIDSLDTVESSISDMDTAVEKIMHDESLHLNWYVELSSLYDAVALNKTLGDQKLAHGNLLVCNFRPTESMRRAIEEADSKFTQKEDFEPTVPIISDYGNGPFSYQSGDLGAGAPTSLPNLDHTSVMRELQSRWAMVADKEVIRYQKVNIFPIYDFPSYIDWRLNVVNITFKLYNPLEQLGAWTNCCTSPVKSDSNISDSNAAFDESNTVMGPIRTMQFTLDLRVPCKHALRYICWSMGVDPAHVLFYSHHPLKLESIWISPVSLDDFCNRDGSLGFVQKPLSDLFVALGKSVRHDPEYPDAVMRSGSINSNAAVSDHSLESDRNPDYNTEVITDSYDHPLPTGQIITLPSNNDSSTDCVDSVRTSRSADAGLSSAAVTAFNNNVVKENNVISMAVFPLCYAELLKKCTITSLTFVVQVFNTRVESVGVCMGHVPVDITVHDFCEVVARHMKLDTSIRWRMIETITDSFAVVDPSSLLGELPQYVNANIRNLLSAPLRIEPDWSLEEQERLHKSQVVPLTVLHQTPDHETFGHPFQLLVDPYWTLAEIKSAIKEKLSLPKREWDRWSFFQQMDGYNRSWKANDDRLDWEKSDDIKLLAEHPKPFDKSRSFCAMRIG
ncbi:Ubiquitin carboxyl-terminal hydrolase family protein [Babesia bovis T2Bo]|uniref:Ubiquitin carboxyl-terminal hydrolase, putative n=1 Tax=Babesia bovis TaxID=5865 RepID=A7AVE4_BABBO|nr:Ubiquitin carboxyl-terminal hydrolase family protein [Babesia bovis T2Bo]EDO05770.1 Ubiquitin carboxyl-terminal hydrolase family protein [Babesia bovis T2Bo]|eukprot:XP_001609338.1 ubiquitin carboxyl-terminal hydrolase [Babesia bovis T2Bo]